MMSKCGSCGGSRFELKENSPTGSNFKVFFVQCSSCGVPVGTMDYYDVHSTIKASEKKVEGYLQNLESEIANLTYAVRNLSR